MKQYIKTLNLMTIYQKKMKIDILWEKTGLYLVQEF